ncbi:hypothetical protein N665_0018s0035 [Sinapis alba]|nr:hypothetical protein N665_0018s0035 [Sinapis alba]
MLCIIIRGYHLKVQKRVFDDEAMMIYPWDRSAYEVLVNSIKMLSPQGWSYTINGLKDMLQVWAYEYVSCLGERFGRVVNEEEICCFDGVESVHVQVLRLSSLRRSEIMAWKIVINESLQEHFPQWPDEADDPRLVNLIINIHADKNIRDRVEAAVYERLKDLGVGENNVNPIPSLPAPHDFSQKSVNSPPPTVYKTPAKKFWSENVFGEQVAKANAKGLGTKLDPEDEVAKATEVKKNLVKDFGNTEVDFVYVSPAKDQPYRRGCGGKTKQKEDEEVAAKKKEAAELKKKQAELKKQAAELKKQKVAELKKQKAEVQKDAPVIRRTRAGVIRIHITQKKHIEDDSELMDVTDDHVALQNELLSESDVEEDERIRSARIKFYRERGDQLSPNVLAVMSAAVAPLAHIFPYIGDNRTMHARKDIEPSATIYDPIVLADSVKIHKLMQHLHSFEKISLKQAHEDVEFYRILITKRPWPNLEYEWLYQNTNLKWLQDVDHLYKVINIRGDHWVGFDVDLLKEKIDCYDPIIEHVTEESEQKVLTAFRPLTQMIHVMMSEVIHASI